METAPTTSTVPATAVNNQQQYLTFRLGDEEYGVEIMRVMEIRGWISSTRLPNTPEFVMGVINLRGVVIPILDMSRRFGMGEAVLTPQSVIVILRTNERTLGILVDSVSDILNVQESDIKTAPPMSYSIDDNFLSGLVSLGERMVVLLNTETIFSGCMLGALDKAAE